MATEVIIPALGEVVEEVRILDWFKSEGDAVEKGELLLEVESEKVSIEIEAPASGILGRILFPKGSQVGVTQVVGIIVAEGEVVPDSYARVFPSRTVSPESKPREQKATGEEKVGGVRVVPAARKMAQQSGVDLSLVKPTGPHGTIMKKDVEAYVGSLEKEKDRRTAGEKIKASPLARTMASSQGLDLAEIQGTGPGGRIVKGDILRTLKEQETLGDQGKRALETIPIRGARRAIFDNMSRSLSQTAQLSLHTEACAVALVAYRDHLNERLVGEEPRISYNAILAKIVACALRRHPRINASVERDEIKVWQQIHIGFAMESEDGLLVPVIRNPDCKSISQINQELHELTVKTREKRLLPDDLVNGTFTISNLGFADIDHFTPILRPPESALLGVGRIVEKPIVKDTRIVAEHRIGLSLTFDHRIIDGAPAAWFLKTIKDIIEEPVPAISSSEKGIPG